jgi:hypothetical protein
MDEKKLRPCLSKERDRFDKCQGDGWIHNGNWWFCETCETRFKQKGICGGYDDFSMVETLDHVRGALW